MKKYCYLWLSAIAIVFIGCNKSEQIYNEISNPKDGSVLIEIPAGQFIMGSNNESADEKQRKEYLDKYYIGKYEITVLQFRQYCKATNKTMPVQPNWNNRDDQPVVNVSWHDAVAYCNWAGLRLPTEAEWEKAARGLDARKYSWGNSWDGNKCNHGSKGINTDNSDGYEYTSPVGSFAFDKSPYGAYDMAGNVFEWCNGRYSTFVSLVKTRIWLSPNGTQRMLRGGCYYSSPIGCTTTGRRACAEDNTTMYNAIGFRVAR